MTVSFQLQRGEGATYASVQTFYDEAGRAFWSACEIDADNGALINDLELHTESEGQILFIDGYSPREGWVETEAEPPHAFPGEVRIEYGRRLPRGGSVRLTKPGEWAAFYNDRQSWLCVAPASARQNGVAVSIYPGLILVLDGDQLAAIWLRVLPQRPSLN